jgi:hypothetical protein
MIKLIQRKKSLLSTGTVLVSVDKKKKLLPINKEIPEVSPVISKFAHLTFQPKPIETHVNSSVQEILDYWLRYGLKSLPKQGTKSFDTLVHSLNQLIYGKFFNGKIGCEAFQNTKFRTDQIKIVIDNFALSTKELDYYPVNKSYLKSCTLLSFLYSPYNTYTKSYFLHYLQHEPIKRIIDKNERLTNYLLGLYKTEILNGTKVDITNKTKEKMIDASSKLKTFFTKNQTKIRSGVVINEMKMARWLYESLVMDVKDLGKISPGFFCSGETFERRLPVYLNSQAIFK